MGLRLRPFRTSCAKQAKSTWATLIRTGVGRALPSSGVAATWSTLWTSWTVLSLEGEGSGSLKRAREAVVVAVAVAGLAPGPGPGPAHGGPAGLVLAPGPAQSLVTGDPEDPQTRIAPGLDPGLEPEGPGAAAAPKMMPSFGQPGLWRLGLSLLSPTIR